MKAKVKQQNKEYVLNGSVQEWKEYADRMNSKLGSLKSCINNVFAYESGMSEYFRMHDYRNMYELFNKMVAETRASLLKSSELNKEEHGE